MQAREEQDRSQRSAQEQLAELQTQFQSMKVRFLVRSLQSRPLTVAASPAKIKACCWQATVM